MHIATSFGMPLRWRKQAQRPPGPFVEDEIDSLSREVNGCSRIDELSGFEGVKARGDVNQSPLILDVEALAPPKPSSNVEEKPVHGGRSGFNANQSIPIPETKQGPKQTPARRPAVENQFQGSGTSRPRSPHKSQDVPPLYQSTKSTPTRDPEVKRTSPVTTQKPIIPRQQEPAPRSSGTRMDALPSKSTSDVPQNTQPPSRTPSVRRAQEQYKSGSPTRRPEPADSHAIRTSSPSKRVPEVAPKPQSVPSRTPSVRRDKVEYIPSQPILPPRPEPASYVSVRTASPPKRFADVAQTAPTVQSYPVRAPQESPQWFPPTMPHHPGPIRDTGMQGYALPPKQQPDVTRQSQPTVPRPLPTPPDDGPRKLSPSRVSPPVTAVREPGLRMDMPPRPLADVPQKTQSPPYPQPVPLEHTQYKSFPPTLPPRPLPEMSQRSQTTPLHPLPNPPADGPRVPSSSTVKRSGSLKQGPSTKPPTAKPLPNSGYASDSTAVRYPQVPRPSSQSPPLEADKNSPPRVSVAERLEEKLKLRREQRDSGDYLAQSQTSSSPELKGPVRPSPIQPPGAWPSDLPLDPSPDRLTQFPTLETTNDQKSEAEKPQPEKPQADKPPAAAVPLKPALRSQSLDRSQPTSTQITRRRTVSFAENPIEASSQALVKVDHETALTKQGGSPDSSRSSSPNSGLTLSPCPRSIPVAGYQDWHTIEGLTHLDICPSCVKQMRKTRFRDRITLSVPKPRNEPIHCAMSEPWARLAWMQTLKKKLDNLDLLRDMTLPPQSVKPCPGRIVSDQYWYRIVDPETGVYLPQFNVCPACVRNIRLLMPAHRETFERSSTPQERVCDFVIDSPRFIRYIDALDLSANRAESDDRKSSLELTEFLAYARRKVVLRDCRRSRLIFDKWHYLPELPEFTVCEDCYDDVVWPLAKARHPIALDFSRSLRLLPGDTASGSSGHKGREASCQLYSPRIRAKFNDAVRRDDMPFIKWMAMTRFDAEQRFRGRQDELVEDQKRGYDCSGDIRKNLEDWKRYE